MGKTKANTAMHGLSGRIDNWVYRTRVSDGKTVICTPPTPGTNPPSNAQDTWREKFRLGSAFAKEGANDPVLRAAYEEYAKAHGLTVYVAMMTDYLNPPTVGPIDMTSYRGRVGDVIKIRAIDEVGVTEVNVAVRAADLSVIEEGSAVLKLGLWVYTATTPRVAGEVVTFTATAMDRAGNTGTMTVNWPSQP